MKYVDDTLSDRVREMFEPRVAHVAECMIAHTPLVLPRFAAALLLVAHVEGFEDSDLPDISADVPPAAKFRALDWIMEQLEAHNAASSN